MNKERFNWWCEDIGVIHKALNGNFEELDKLDVVAVLEYPLVDIELTIRDYNEEEGTLYYDYFCCVNKTGNEEVDNMLYYDSYDGWESYDGVPFGKTDPKEFTTVEELKSDMNKQLIKFCRKEDLKMY